MRLFLIFESLLVYPGERSIYSDPEHVLDHPGEENLEELAGLLDAGVRVDLDEPDVEVLVEDEVVAEELEGVLPLVGVDLLADRVHGLHDQLLDLGEHVPVDRDPAVRVGVRDDLLEALVA